MWASGAKIEAAGPADEPLVGDGVKQVLEFERDMVKAGNVHEGDRAKNAKRSTSSWIGQGRHDGTGNFNISLAREQNPTMDFGISLLPGVEPNSSASFIGGDLWSSEGQQACRRCGNFMKSSCRTRSRSRSMPRTST